MWKKLEPPLTEILIHFIVTVVSIVSIAGTELLLRIVGLDGKIIPLTDIPLGDWFFDLEALAATLIIGIGICKAAWKLVWS